MKVAIVGYGMAGARIARELGRRGVEVTVFGAEPTAAYNRILLSGLIAGKQREAEIALPVPPDNVTLRLGEAVEAVDLDAKTVNGVPFDKLVLATGAEAFVPPIPGLDPLPTGAYVLRTIEDARAILDEAANRAGAIVLGGGLLGLEAARGLAGRGMDVTVVHAATHLMERQLDPVGAKVLAESYGEVGVGSVTDAQTVEVVHGDDGLTLVLADGGTVTGQLLVVSCGVKPNTALAASMGIACGRAVVIDDQCRTSHPDVFAVGDCAEHRGIPYGLVGPAWEQADVVVDLLSGVNPDAAYEGSRLVTRLKAAGIDLAAMGEVDGDEVVSFADPTRGTYARLVIDADGRLAGAVMLGDNPMVGQVVQLFDTGDPVPHDRRTLLMGRPGESVSVAPETPASMPDEVVVCRCNNVTKGTLSRAFLDGARTPEALTEATQASTGCGTCAEDVAGICKWLNGTVAGLGQAAAVIDAARMNEVSAS
ncbi:FAD-dependent oxidoreductase [Glycomyces harbinensis]|uniref:Assimilatory nitrate reductase electron transfer subunit n=1 Tax=Glycomyces harbinensis TaxID=58114 RepID=A0A1G7DIG7_9ACTN|nr:FAD-dependent oxidoreductase [Glycomyces harbinensis]SDE51348.1 assimilatory nitrate reductase electron transfer subunit [Glycomyces harbinensis]